MTDDAPDVRSTPAKYPKTLALKSGEDVRVAQVCYEFGRGFARVTYERNGKLKGCVAEIDGTRWIESDMSQAVGKVEANPVTVLMDVERTELPSPQSEEKGTA